MIRFNHFKVTLTLKTNLLFFCEGRKIGDGMSFHNYGVKGVWCQALAIHKIDMNMILQLGRVCIKNKENAFKIK